MCFFFFHILNLSADARDVPLTKAGVWFDDQVLKMRAIFRGQTNDASILAISNITIGDQAIYRCRVDFRESKSRNARINLVVVGNANFIFL